MECCSEKDIKNKKFQDFYKGELENPTENIHIIPEPKIFYVPKNVKETFKITSLTYIDNQAGNNIQNAVNLFTSHIEKSFGIIFSKNSDSGNTIKLIKDNTIKNKEAYKLMVNSKVIEIHASEYAGFLYAFYTLMQLMPSEVYSKTKIKENIDINIPAVLIYDEPRFEWRGYMLDESRTFFGKDMVLTLLDEISKLKINKFHWHLTDDGGYRFPFSGTVKCSSGNEYNLDEFMKKAAWRNGENPANYESKWEFCKKDDNNAYGGVYTKEDLKEIINYAKERNIIIIPEFDIPGHSKPMYELIVSSKNKLDTLKCDAYYRNEERNINKQKFDEKLRGSDLCPSNNDTIEVIVYMLKQMYNTFECEYVHIGGDEVRIAGNENLGNGPWWYCKRCEDKLKELNFGEASYENFQKLQGWFFKELSPKLLNDNIKMAMWNEAAVLGDFKPDTESLIMAWDISEAHSDKLYNTKAKIVNAAQQKYYFPFYQTKEDKDNNDKYPIGAAWAKVNTMKDMYEYNPCENNSGSIIPKELQIGIQSCYWTEKTIGFEKEGITYTPKMHLVYMTFPRIVAVAERAWSPEEKKDYNKFLNKMQTQFERFDKAGLKGVCQTERKI